MNAKVMPALALTPGEPAGIGPDLALMLAQYELPCVLAVVADPELLAARAEFLGMALELAVFDGQPHRKGALAVLPPARAASHYAPGKLSPANSGYVLETLKTAVEACLNGQFDAMVTGPVHKGVINEAGVAFSGHTEFLAERCGASKPVMVLANKHLKVALATTHLPLREVADAITVDELKAVIRVLDHDLKQKYGITQPGILVCGLNPHAGEDGHLGREEIEVISPALDALRTEGIQLIGPIPADTAFTPDALKRADAVLAMYHDQGLPVIKSQGFGEIVNITFGLPIIRTSVDHGTAVGLAGTGKAKVDSLLTAIEVAIDMANQRAVV